MHCFQFFTVINAIISPTAESIPPCPTSIPFHFMPTEPGPWGGGSSCTGSGNAFLCWALHPSEGWEQKRGLGELGEVRLDSLLSCCLCKCRNIFKTIDHLGKKTFVCIENGKHWGLSGFGEALSTPSGVWSHHLKSYREGNHRFTVSPKVSLKLEELHSVAQLQFCLMTQTLLEAKFPQPSNNEMP